MHKNKYNHYYLYSTIITTFIVVLMFMGCCLNPLFSYFLPQFLLSAFIFLSINVNFIFSKSKKTNALKEWFHSFIDMHKDEFMPYVDEANKAVHKFTLMRVTILQIYIISMIMTLFSFFVELDFAYEITDILLVALQYYAYIILLLFGFIFVNHRMHKKYYFRYLEPNNNNHVYLYMTYLLLQIRNVDKVYLNYNDLINTSASLTRLGYFNESFEFITLWKSQFKKMHPLFTFIYIEHCLFDFVMLKRDDDVVFAYQDYMTNLNKYKKYTKHKTIQYCTYFVDLLYAYHNKNYEHVIALSKDCDKYMKKDDYKDSFNYILYKSYLHIDENKALEIKNNNPNNLFIQKENV